VFTDEGITEYGEAFRLTPSAVSILIEEALKPHLVGENPLHIEKGKLKQSVSNLEILGQHM